MIFTFILNCWSCYGIIISPKIHLSQINTLPWNKTFFFFIYLVALRTNCAVTTTIIINIRVDILKLIDIKSIMYYTICNPGDSLIRTQLEGQTSLQRTLIKRTKALEKLSNNLPQHSFRFLHWWLFLPMLATGCSLPFR